MIPQHFRLAFVASDAPDAQLAAAELKEAYEHVAPADADVVVALGGDGFMLQTLHTTMGSDKPVYGMNRGSVGFLMNRYRVEGLRQRVEHAVENAFQPLEMRAIGSDGSEICALAINEVYLFRQSFQAAKLRVVVDGRVRLEELTCDGILLATPAGSTAYNLSAHGPILPLDAPLLALTPVSPFRPRRWRGALLSNRATVEIEILESEKRPVNAVADHVEVKSVQKLTIAQATSSTARMLTDPDHSWSERILAEQFSF